MAVPQFQLRLRHERLILQLVRAKGPVTRPFLSEQTGLSAQTVGDIIQALHDDALIEPVEVDRPPGPGKPPIGFRIRADGAWALGFGLERDALTGVLLDLTGDVCWSTSIDLPEGEASEVTLGRIARQVTGLLAEPVWAARRDRVAGVGVVAPGPLRLQEGTLVAPPNFPSWDRVNIPQALGASVSLPVLVDNSASAAALGVLWRRRAHQGSFVYCYWGMGIGGGLVLRDTLYRGTTGNVVEIGHVIVDPEGRPCHCGARGCLEAEASVEAILAAAARWGRYETLDDVVAARVSSEPVAAILDRAAALLGNALVSVVNLLDVSEVVIGGHHFPTVAPIFLPVIQRAVSRQVLRRHITSTSVTVSDLGEEANAIGAATLVLHKGLPATARRYRSQRDARAALLSDLAAPYGMADMAPPYP
jgi:predicted NBD/HSP70 family sugar kinase